MTRQPTAAEVTQDRIHQAFFANQKRNYRIFFVVEGILFVILALFCAGMSAFNESLHEANRAHPWVGRVLLFVFTILSLWHVVAIPIGFLYLIGKPVVMTLSPLIPCAETRAFNRRLRQRQELSDDDFYFQYYVNSTISRDVPIRLRRCLAANLDPMLLRAIPSDLLQYWDDELDFAYIIDLIRREFKIPIDNMDYLCIDGSFDSLVRLIQLRRLSMRAP